MPTRGPAEAPVTVVEFSDFQCPHCARGAATMDDVVAKFPTEVRFVFMHYPLPGHDWARQASIAALCAGQQKPEAHWQMHDAFFAQQSAISEANVTAMSVEFARATGIDLTTWQACAEKPSTAEHQQAAALVAQAQALGDQLDVDGTPSFFINGEQAHGAVPFEMMAELVREALPPQP